MGIVVVPDFGADPVSVTGPTLDSKVNGLATEFNGNIEDANIKAGAAIGNAKLNLASIAQNVTLAGTTTISGASTVSGIQTFSSKIQKLAKGADVASAAGAMTLGEDGNYFDITGTEAITSITAKAAGTVVTLQFDSTATLTDGSNLKLDGNFTGAAGSTITLVSDGTNWFEKSRSPLSSTVTYATAAEVKTGTESAKSVAPSTMIGHEGICKGWINMNGTGTPAIKDSYNVSGIVDNGTGDYTITWDVDFGSGNYAIAGMSIESGANTGAYIDVKAGTTKAVGTVNIISTNAAGNAFDSSEISVIAIGDR